MSRYFDNTFYEINKEVYSKLFSAHLLLNTLVRNGKLDGELNNMLYRDIPDSTIEEINKRKEILFINGDLQY